MTQRGSVMAAALAVILHTTSSVRAQPTPTVTGPDDGQETRGISLPGPGSRPLSAALRLDFQGDCLERGELAKSAERWLAHQRVNDRITIAVSGEEDPVLGARFWLLVDGQRASLRRFEDFGGSCAELTSSLSAAIGLAIEAVDLSEFPVPEKEPTKTILPVARLTARSPLQRDEPPKPVPSPRRRPGLVQTVRFGGHLLGGIGVAPASATGVGIRAELGFVRGLSARLGANYLSVATAAVADGSVEVTTFAAQPGVCWGGQKDNFGAQVCLDVWVGSMTARPENLDRASERTLPWLALAPAAEVRYQASEDLAVRFGAQLSFNLVRPRFEVFYNTRDEPLDRREVPPLGLIGSVGLDWSLL